MLKRRTLQTHKGSIWRRALDWLRGQSPEQQIERLKQDLTNRRADGWPVRKNVNGEATTVLPPIRLRPPIQSAPDDRDHPILLRGRDTEFSFIANRISNMPKPIIALEGPPGAGKSALLHAAEHYARHQGFLSINLQPTEIDNREALVEGLRSQMEAGLKTNLRDMRNTDKGIFRLIHNFGAIDWEKAPRTICRQAIALAQECGYRGILLTIDEAQSWVDDYPTKERVKPFAKELLLHLNDQHANADMQHPIQLIVAGTFGTLAGTCRIMSRRLARGHQLTVGPIHDKAIAQIIQDRLNFVCDDNTVPAALPPAIMAEVKNIAQGHTAHATNLAADLMDSAIDAGRSQDPQYFDDKMSGTIQNLHQQRDKHYLKREDALRQRGEANVHLAHLFAYIQQRTGGNLKPSQLKTVCRQLLPKYEPHEIDDLVEEYIFDLCRRNVLTHIKGFNPTADGDQNLVATEYYVAPTPSFSHFIVRTTQQADPDEHEMLVEKAAALLPEIGAPAQPWQPTTEFTITPYEPIRPIPHGGHVTDVTLQPTLACDSDGTPLTPADVDRIKRNRTSRRTTAGLNPTGQAPTAPTCPATNDRT